jgi:hypothetical protein
MNKLIIDNGSYISKNGFAVDRTPRFDKFLFDIHSVVYGSEKNTNVNYFLIG